MRRVDWHELGLVALVGAGGVDRYRPRFSPRVRRAARLGTLAFGLVTIDFLLNRTR